MKNLKTASYIGFAISIKMIFCGAKTGILVIIYRTNDDVRFVVFYDE
jgi:hypothetical protein